MKNKIQEYQTFIFNSGSFLIYQLSVLRSIYGPSYHNKNEEEEDEDSSSIQRSILNILPFPFYEIYRLIWG